MNLVVSAGTNGTTPLVPKTASDLPSDHHRELMKRLTGPEALVLLKRFTIDFNSDPDLSRISRTEAKFLYERGFLPEKIRLYGISEHNIDLYLSDVQRWLTRHVNGKYSVAFNDKILFTQVFGRHCSVPRIIAIARNGRVIECDAAWSAIVNGSGAVPMVVAKPLGGGGGGSIFFIRVNGDYAVVETSDKDTPRITVKRSELPSVLAGQPVPFIVNEYIEQGSFSRSLYPLTVNTLRVLVVRDPSTLRPYVARVCQRIGTSDSYPIDNFSTGGLSAQVDLETGCLGDAVAAEGKYRGVMLRSHPDTGESLAGRVVPGWSDIKNGMCSLFTKIPYINYCGFDVILRDDGFVVLEGNSYSQVRLFQMAKPLLMDQTLVGFYRSAKILL